MRYAYYKDGFFGSLNQRTKKPANVFVVTLYKDDALIFKNIFFFFFIKCPNFLNEIVFFFTAQKLSSSSVLAASPDAQYLGMSFFTLENKLLLVIEMCKEIAIAILTQKLVIASRNQWNLRSEHFHLRWRARAAELKQRKLSCV